MRFPPQTANVMWSGGVMTAGFQRAFVTPPAFRQAQRSAMTLWKRAQYHNERTHTYIKHSAHRHTWCARTRRRTLYT